MEEKEKTKDRSVPDGSDNYPQNRCQLEGLLAIKMIIIDLKRRRREERNTGKSDFFPQDKYQVKGS